MANSTKSDDGGYIVPEVITVKRRGILGRLARFFGLSYGWKDFRLADAITGHVERARKNGFYKTLP